MVVDKGGLPPLDVVVIGGSVGGLAVAHALLRAGCSVIVCERAERVAAAGAVSLGLQTLQLGSQENFFVGHCHVMSVKCITRAICTSILQKSLRDCFFCIFVSFMGPCVRP